jgi:FtsP/CotA-like multicopper oxidase with cupredoxin domain
MSRECRHKPLVRRASLQILLPGGVHMSNRRGFFRNVWAWGAGMAASPRLRSAEVPRPMVETPDIPTLPCVKVFHLVAEPVTHRISPFKTITAWGYNGSVPGPTIQVTQGDRVRIVVENHLPESTNVHWHGFEIPFEMDGTPYISHKPIPPGGKCVYEFDLHQEGTFSTTPMGRCRK